LAALIHGRSLTYELPEGGVAANAAAAKTVVKTIAIRMYPFCPFF
jgi:hypothetical protein